MPKIYYIALVLLLSYSQCQQEQQASVIFNKVTGKYSIIQGIDKEAVAYGTYTPSYEAKGWDYLTISSYMGDSKKYTDLQKAYAMGYLEGQFTHKRITPFYHNCVVSHLSDCNYEMPDQVRKFFIDNFEFIKKESSQKMSTDPYWAHIHNIYYQLKGLNDGYNDMVPQEDKISLIDFQVMSAFGDITVVKYIKKEARPDFSKMTPEEVGRYFDETNHCSSLIKVASDFSDLWFGHNSWMSYPHMIRIFKEYRYNSLVFPEEGKAVAFSSYPGNLASQDDFYITSNDLYVTETTNSIFKVELYDKLTPKSILTWMRAVVSNRLSSTAKDWVEMFSRYNSGTYNNQFQVIDLKKIDVKNEKLKINEEALMIIEQIPGYVEIHDQTNILKKGYWPSYNSPYSTNIQDMSGYTEYLQEHPELEIKSHYYKGARPSIFRREQGSINDIDSYKNLIRYNNYQKEEFSKNDPSLTIAARKDLLDKDPICNGNTDAKFASIKDVKSKEGKSIWIISGPTNQGGIENFSWSKTKCGADKKEYTHEGQVDEFNFDWILYNTTLF